MSDLKPIKDNKSEWKSAVGTLVAALAVLASIYGIAKWSEHKAVSDLAESTQRINLETRSSIKRANAALQDYCKAKNATYDKKKGACIAKPERYTVLDAEWALCFHHYELMDVIYASLERQGMSREWVEGVWARGMDGSVRFGGSAQTYCDGIQTGHTNALSNKASGLTQ